MIGEQPDGSITEVESRDVDFIENEFLGRGEVDKDLTLYEMMESRDVDFIKNEFLGRGEVDKDLTLYEMMDPNE